MNTKAHIIEISGIPVEIVRKNIKNLHLGTYPPYGRVRVAVPLRLTDEAVRMAVISRLGWIRRQQSRFEQQERQSEREMVSGESHYVLGRRYRLIVFEDNVSSVAKRNNSVLEMRALPHSTREDRKNLLHRWYRTILQERIPGLIDKWERIVGVTIADYRIRRMKTRWGSCNSAERRICLNLELAKKPSSCLEYILVHEMVHILERHHTERFKELMDRFMPQWRSYRDELNRTPLAYENWTY